MEIRCSKCGHVGPTADVRPVDGGVGLVCSQCGHINIAAPDDTTSPPHTEEGDETRDLAESRVDSVALTAAVQRLIPEAGRGQRCRKCAHLFAKADIDYCPRCGLSVEESELYELDEAPWERPPTGKEQEFVQALELWSHVRSGDAKSMEDFVDFVVEKGLVELGIRKMQHYLVDHDQDPAALAGLSRLAARLEVEINLARTRAEAEADEFNDDVKRFRKGLLFGALLFWASILLLFLLLFWDNVW